MFGKKRSEDHKLNELAETLTRIEAALVVHDPGGARSAEAYEGLRRAVVAGGRDRRRHLAHLVEIAEAIERGTTTTDLGVLVEQWCHEEGLEKSADPSRPELFQITDREGDLIQVLKPAWVDTSGEGKPSLVKQGFAGYVSSAIPDDEQETK